MGHKVREIKDFVAPGSMSAKDKKTLGEQAVFYQNSIRDVNQTIRDITGAAMNKDESVRIMEQVANLDDTGTVFIYKLLNSQKMFAEAAKRKQQKLKELTDVGVKWEEAMPVSNRYAAAYMISAGAASEAEARQLAETDAWGLEDVGTDTFDPGPDYEQQEDGSWIYTGGE